VHLAEKGNPVLVRKARDGKKAVGRLRQPAGVYDPRSARHGSLVGAKPPFGSLIRAKFGWNPPESQGKPRRGTINGIFTFPAVGAGEG
jgi:hypothetical protein